MGTYRRYKFFKALAVNFFSLSLLLGSAGNSWALSCREAKRDPQKFDYNIEQLKTGNQDLDEQLTIVDNWSRQLYPLSDSETDLQNHSFCSLIAAVKDSTLDVVVRNNAAYALRGVGTGAEDAIPILQQLIINPNVKPEIRQSAIWAIRGIGAGSSVNQLFQALKDQKNPEVSSVAAEALLSFTNKSRLRDAGVVPILIKILEDNPNSKARSNAAKALGQIGIHNTDLVAKLSQTLKDPSWFVRRDAADALGRIAQNTDDPEILNALEDTVPNLRELLSDKNYTLRDYVVSTLGWIGVKKNLDQETLEKLRIALKNDSNLSIKVKVTSNLGKLLAEGNSFDEKSFNSLITALPEHPQNAAKALEKIANSFPEKVEGGQIEFKEAISYLDQALTAIKSIQEFPKEKAEPILEIFKKVEIEATLERQKQIIRVLFIRTFIINNLRTNYWFWAAVIFLASYGGIFWLRPLWLLKLDEGLLILEPITEGKNPVVAAIASTLKIILGLSPLTYHPRVLDAWVSTHLSSVREIFQEKDTVRERQVYVSSPVILNERTTVAQLKGKDLQKYFSKRKQMLIWGEGGSGKTSLACQIAKWGMSDDEDERLCKHRMLPVLIEEDLVPEVVEGNCPFTTAILGQLNDELGEETSSISPKLFEKLLRKQRILVIVDHFSEMSAQTRHLIRPEMPECPVKALVITSRVKESLGHLIKTTIQPLRIEGNRLSSFMENYLRQLGKRELFTDEEFFNHCRQLSHLAGQGNITALLARLYADQMINAKEKSARAFPALLADNIPDLMLSYLNTLNRDIQENKLADRKVHKAAKIVAWECLKENYKPIAARREDILTALGGEDAEQQLEYLEKRLHLIQTVNPAQDCIHTLCS